MPLTEPDHPADPAPIPRILIVNPNTSSAITDIMVSAGTARAADRAEIIGITAPFGAAALESPAELVVAAHAVLDAIANGPDADAIIIGAFGDPGRAAAAALSAVPVLGLAQSGLLAAGDRGRRFAVITLGPRLEPAIRTAIADAGLSGQLADLRFIPGAVLDVAADRARVLDALIAAARTAVDDTGAEAILFGGGPFAGIGAEIESCLDVPVFDGLTSAVDRALHLAAVPRATDGGGSGSRSKPLPDNMKSYPGISPALARLIAAELRR